MEDRQENEEVSNEEVNDSTTEQNDDVQVKPKLSAEEILDAERGRLEKKYSSEIDKLTNKLSRLEKEKDDQRKAEMTELDVLKEEFETMKEQNITITQEKDELIQTYAKSTWINENASNLPSAYKKLVEGNTEEEMTESLVSVVTQYESDIEGIIGDKKQVSIGQKAPISEEQVDLTNKSVNELTTDDELKNFLIKKGVSNIK